MPTFILMGEGICKIRQPARRCQSKLLQKTKVVPPERGELIALPVKNWLVLAEEVSKLLKTSPTPSWNQLRE